MAHFSCIGCGTLCDSPCKPDSWHTLLLEIDDVGSVRSARTTSKMRLLCFCSGCEPIAIRFAHALGARETTPSTKNDAVETLDERPALFNAVPAMAR